MSIAVVIPLYNGERHIRQSLDSVLEQTRRPDEVVVVDDGSTDSSVFIVEAYAEVCLLENPGNGPNVARNHGLRTTESEMVAFMDHDDLWHPKHLQRLSRSLDEEPDSPASVSTKTHFRDGERPQYAVGTRNYDLRDSWAEYPVTAFGPPSLALIRREALQAVDGWSAQYDGNGDYFMWLKLGLLGPFVVNESSTAAYRYVDNSYSSELRGNRPLRYYQRHVEASRRALQLRKRTGLDSETHARRCRAQEATLALLKVFLPDERGDLQHAAKQFDQNVSEISRRVSRRLWGTFQWYMRPHVQEIGRKTFAAQVIDLVDRWPYADSRLRKMLREWAFSLTPAVDLLNQYSARLSCWRHLLGRGRKRIRSMIPA
jgi:glycosyltransferase involved in cell wall biosynthesis